VTSWSRAGALATAIALAAGCGGNGLTGSIGEVVSLSFSEVELVKLGEELSVEYLCRCDKGGVDKVCILVLDATGMGLDDGAAIRGDAFDERVTLRRAVRSGDLFPEIEHGSLELSEIAFRHKGRAAGEFTVVFVNGRTLEGSFSGSILEREL
jgi:hypothetical protein